MSGLLTSKAMLMRLVLAVSVGMVAAACGGGGGGTGGTTAKPDLVIRLPGEPTGQGFILSQDPTDMWGEFLNVSLVTQDSLGKTWPRLAQSWQISPDSKTHTFKLNDWTWSDGTPVTSADVKYSFENVLLPYSPLAKAAYGNITSVDAPDAHTAVIHVSTPTDLMPALTPFYAGIVPKHVYEGKDVRSNPANKKPISAGPYKFQSYVSGSAVTLVRNPYWKGTQLPFDRVIWKVIPDDQAAVAALKQGEIDVIPAFPALNISSVLDLKKDSRFNVVPLGSYNYDMDVLIFNSYVPPLNNLDVRKAIAHAIDRQTISKAIYSGQFPVATGFMAFNGTGKKYSGPYLQPYDYNVATAKSLLDQAGFPVQSNGQRFTLRYTVAKAWPQPDMMTAICSYLEKVQVACDGSVADAPTVWNSVFAWKEGADPPWHGYNMGLITGEWTTPNMLKTWYASSSIAPGTLFVNDWPFSNAEFDNHIATALSTAGDEKVAAVKAAQEVLADHLPSLPLFEDVFYVVTNANLKLKDNLPPGGGIYVETPLDPFGMSWGG
jgi:peptide/nickel transport system substrate-binding protein